MIVWGSFFLLLVKGGGLLFALDVLVQHLLSNRTFISIYFRFQLEQNSAAPYIDVEMSVFAGDDLNSGHDMIEELVVDLLRQGLGVRVSQRDVQQLHKGLDGAALQTRI
jgi:hypothetical protein